MVIQNSLQKLCNMKAKLILFSLFIITNNYLIAQTWDEVIKLTTLEDPAAGQLSVSAATDEDRAIVGAYGDTAEGSFTGATYIFEREGASVSF